MIVKEGEKGSSDHFLFVGSSICSVLYGYIIIWFVYKLLLMGGNSTLCHVWILFVHIWCMNAMQQQQPQIASFFFSISMSAMWWTQRIFLTSCVLIEKPVETHILHLPCHFTTLSLFAVLIAGWRTACCQNHQRDIKKKKKKRKGTTTKTHTPNVHVFVGMKVHLCEANSLQPTIDRPKASL